MGYIEEYDLLNDETNNLHKKVARAIDKAARDIVNEDVGTENHAARLVWAGNVRARNERDRLLTEAKRAMPYVMDNATVASAGNDALDSDVQFVVNGIVNTLAGV